jgi:kynurenine formamidase
MNDLIKKLAAGKVRVVDLTHTLSPEFPYISLPPEMGQAWPFRIEEVSRYDDRGPAWYWNDIHTGEHTGTHVDAPNHWVTGRGGLDVSQAPLRTLIGPAAVIDKSAEAAADPDFLLEVDHVRAWTDEHGPLPEGGWLLLRTGWDARSHDQEAFTNADEHGPHTPGVSAACARWIAQESPVAGFGTETVGTDAGAAGGFDPPFSCHHFLMGAGKWGLTSLQNLALLPPTGAVVVVSPLPIVGGSGSPARVYALVER